MRRRARSSSRGHTDRSFFRSTSTDADAMPQHHTRRPSRVRSIIYLRRLSESVPLLPALGLRIDRVQHDLAEQVIDDCEPRGMSRGHRQWGSTWGLFRENPPEKSHEQPFAWDPDGLIYSAVALSRLVQPIHE